MRLKVEINTREHFTVSGIQRRRFSVENPWFSGAADICTHEVEELLGTKLRALYQRKKGRDLYDLWLAMTTLETDEQKIVHCFEQYLEHGGTPVSRAEFEMNLMGKMKDPCLYQGRGTASADRDALRYRAGRRNDPQPPNKQAARRPVEGTRFQRTFQEVTLAINPIVFTEKIVRSFLRYQLTAYPFADEDLLAQMRQLLSLDHTRRSPLLKGPYVSPVAPLPKGRRR